MGYKLVQKNTVSDADNLYQLQNFEKKLHLIQYALFCRVEEISDEVKTENGINYQFEVYEKVAAA